MAKHAAPTATRVTTGQTSGGRHRAPIDLRGKATPVISRNRYPGSDVGQMQDGSHARIRRGSTGAVVTPLSGQRPQTKYIPKGALYTPRGPRTRYIQYIGNQDANNTGKLVGEWLLGVVLICVAVPKQAANAGYQKTITRIMYRLTALTAVFFVLALMSNTKGGKTAVYAGLLIDLGILFNMVQTGTITGITEIMTGKTIVANGTQPVADVTTPKAFPIQGGLVDLTHSSNTPGGGGNPPVPA